MDKLILINKEMGMTSHDLVNIVRRTTRMKRVGHTGTLDPNATGLMIVAMNKATKLVNYLQNDDKEYVLEMKFGLLTDTLDVWGKTLKTEEEIVPTKDELEQVLNSFLGKSKQIPPMYSAIKVDGKKLYELARENIEIEREAREIEITEIELLDMSPIKIRVVCSSGTYVRSLVSDIAERLGTVGVMTSLVRTRVGQFNVKDANSVYEIRNNEITYTDPEEALLGYYKIEYSETSDIYNGRRIELDTTEDLVLITINNKSMAFYEREEKNTFKCKRGLW